MALLGRDNHEDLNYNDETTPLTSGYGFEETELFISEDPKPVVSKSDPYSYLLDGKSSSNGDLEREANLQKRKSLHEDVEKLFDLPKKFDIAAFSGGSNPEKSSYYQGNTPGKHVTTIPESKIYGEDDFSSHRRDSFPHIHHPLKALRSRSHKNVRHLELEKPKKEKKKKKKKRKMHVSKSFPSKSATMSPPIPEEAVEGEGSDDDSEDSSASSNDVLDEDNVDGRTSPDFGGGIELTFPPPQTEVDLESALAGVPAEPGTPDFLEKLNYPASSSSTDSKVPQIRIVKPVPPMSEIKFFIGDREMSSSPDQTVPNNQKLLSPRDTWSSEALSEVSEKSEDGLDMKFTLSDLMDQEPVLSPSASKKSGASRSMLDDQENRVQFSVGGDASFATLHSQEGHENTAKPPSIKSQHSRSEGKIHKHKHRHHHDHYKQEDLKIRRQKGSEVKIQNALNQVPTEFDEANMLHSADLDEMASHRLGKVGSMHRHKINKSKSAFTSVVHIGKAEKVRNKIFKAKKKYDHSPHEVFVELDELYALDGEYEWREKARWIKFEEDVEEGAERWGKPHVASLSFHSLLELRRGLENGSMILDLEAEDLPTIINYVIDDMIVHDNIKSENKGKVLKTLLLKHKHVGNRVNAFIRRNISYMNLLGLEGGRHRHQRDKMSLMKSFSTASFRSIPSEVNFEKVKTDPSVDKLDKLEKGEKNDVKNLQFVKVDVDNNMQPLNDGVHIGITTNESRQKNIQDIMRRIPKGAEAITVLVGAVDYLDKPVMAFVRLAEGQVLDNLTEVPLPVRFLFFLLGPEHGGMDYHEVGRSISTLMANQHFHDIAYKALSRDELLHAINEFLDESIVLPPGDWDQKTLLPIMDMARKKARVRRRKKQKEEEKMAILKKEEKEKIPSDPIKRTGCIFGGMINDIRRRYPHYVSDFKDAMNFQSVAAFIFIFFACFAPCIAFGGLLSEKTEDYMGVTETIVSTALSGIIFGLFSAQPLMIVGATGPVLVFEQSLYKFCKVNGIEFLTLRVWISFWVMMITFVAIALESSFLVKYITRFTEEVFTVLISLVFIYEVIHKLIETFEDHPLKSGYCDFDKDNLFNSSFSLNNLTMLNASSAPAYQGHSENPYVISNGNSSLSYSKKDDAGHYKIPPQPNTALLSTILTLGTCLIAYFLRIFRNSKFLGRSARRALGDFGIVIALVVMVLLDYTMQDIYTQKLSIPDKFEPTAPSKRGWFVHPLGTKKRIETYLVFAAFLPAFLIFILLFLETQITEMTLNKKEYKMKKGSGYHLDQVLLGIVTFICGLFGLPWMCAATVRTLCHVSALSVMSRTHAPGEKPKLIEVKEQRLTNIMMNAMIGFALMWGPLLRAIPIAVLFGIFLYVGLSALSSLQMFRRMKLLLIPVKHHPSVGFVRRVRTIKMHLFTIIQVILLVLLLVIKISAAALAFPLFVILLIPLRLKLMGYIFTTHELNELDKEEEDSEDEDEDDPDFYRLAHMPV